MSQFFWDKSIRKYRDENGRAISDARIRKMVNETCAAFALVLIARAMKLKEDFTTDNFQLWNNQTRVDLTALYYASSMVGFGGRDQMEEKQWEKAEENIRFHAGYWENFSQQVALGDSELDGNFPIRTSLYALAGYEVYEDAVRDREADAGSTEERRIPTSGNPCQDCEEAYRLGWSPIGSLPDIGESVCLTRCRCYFEFR